MAGADLESEKRRYRKKIAEWEKLGFDVTGLEGLLDMDFKEFKRRKSQILLGQYKTEEKEEDPNKDQQPAKKQQSKPTPKSVKKKDDEDVATIIIASPEPQPTEPASTGPEEEAEPPQTPPESEAEPHAPVPDAPKPILIGAPLPIKEKSIELKKTGEVVAPESKAKRHATEPETIEIGVGQGDDEEAAVERPGQGRSVRKAAPRDRKKIGFTEEDDGQREVGEGRPGKAPRSPEGSGQFNWKVIGAVVAVAVLIIAGFAIWKYYPKDTESEPDITVSIDASQSPILGIEQGKNISFKARVVCDRSDIQFRYKWIYSSSSFILDSGSDVTQAISGYFRTLGSNTVGLEVTWAWKGTDVSMSASVDMTVSPKIINVNKEQFGQHIQFNTYGTMVVTGMDMQFETFRVSGMDMTFNTDFTDPAFKPQLTVLDCGPHLDGFAVSHNVFDRTEVMNLVLKGNATATSTTRAETKLSLDGSLFVTKKDFISEYSSQTVCSVLNSTFNLALTQTLGKEMSVMSKDSVMSFPDLSKDQSNFRLEDLNEARVFKVGDISTHKFGNTAYTYNTEDVERITVADGTTRDTIRLGLTIDVDTMEQNKILEFNMNLWIQENRPAAVKSYLYLKKENGDGSVATLSMYQSEKDFEAGTLPITYHSDADKPAQSPKRIDELNSAYSPEFSENWVYLPNHGGMYSSVSSFPVASALSGLQADSTTSPTWDSYMADKTDPFALEANVTKKDGSLIWSFAIGDRESKQTLNATASEGGAYSAYVFDGSDHPEYKTSDFEPLLSFSGAQCAIENLTLNLSTDDLVKDARADMFSAPSDLNLNKYRFGVRTSIATPSLDMTSATYFLYLRYGYVIEKKDASDSYSLALDAETGQMAYVWYHKDQQTGFQNPFG